VAAPRLVLLILAVRDLARMRAFYQHVLGWNQVVDAPVYVELQSTEGLRLGLYTETGFGRNIGVVPEPSSVITRTELYLHCDELSEVIDRVVAIGAPTLSPLAPRDWGDEAAYFADPEGNVVVFARPLPRPGG
jgi:catechol 2,3-dioxygenase-like lactoylglutathione lyase family enzyme